MSNANYAYGPPHSPSYTQPRLAPQPPRPPSSPLRAFNNVFRRQDRSPSRQPLPLTTTTTNSTNEHRKSPTPSSTSQDKHPYAVMRTAPHLVVASHDPHEEQECPVCLEPLSFSFRLPGEKPHIVPECGHALHEACFTAVYGPPPNQSRSATLPRKSNLGVCGVCRRPMKVGDGDGGKSNKLASLTGVGPSSGNTGDIFPGRDGAGGSRYARQPANKPYDPNEDDPLDHTGSIRSGPGESHSHYVVAPSIQVRAEFSSLARTNDLNQPLTCIVVIELPGKRAPAAVPGAPLHNAYGGGTVNGRLRREPSNLSHPRSDSSQHQYDPHSDGQHQQQHHHSGSGYNTPNPGHAHPHTGHMSTASSAVNSMGYEPSILSNGGNEDSPFNAITEDLRNRIIDWRGHPLSDLGPLLMYDLLAVRRESLVRELYVYLFREAIICVVEEKKRSLGRLLSGASSFTDSSSLNGSTHGQAKGVLRLRGRIYVRHIKNVTATSAAGEMSLTIDMEDELASFILIFKEKPSLDAWKNNIQALVDSFKHQSGGGGRPTDPHHGQQSPEPGLNIEEFGGSSKAMRMLSGSTQTTVSTVDSLLHGSGRSTLSSVSSHGSTGMRSQMQHQHHQQQNNNNHAKLAPLGEEDEIGHYESPTSMVTPYTSSGPSNSLTPLPHPPMDLILVISVPPVGAVVSTAQLKLRVIRNTFDFILASMSNRDRLSLVTFEVGFGGRVRKTPFLSLAKNQSRMRLNKFIEETGLRGEEAQDEFAVKGSREEKTDVVTAVNHALDVVLQRKSKNPTSGMVLVSDASDTTRRAQMDLVLARAEAGNVPIHSFGYGRSHDPASLWLMSNHTGGTYTFVKDWYDLRDCVAGCVGGIMSIGLSNMKLHMKIVDSHRFRIRKVSGGPSHILASDGQNVDVEVGELRYGEKKEMLIELELDNTDSHRQAANQQNQLGGAMGSNGRGATRAMNATDQFVQSMGLDSLSIDDNADFADGMMARMIDEVPVLEVDGSFYDPASSKNVSRLAHPVLLTITLMPQSAAPARPTNTISDPVIVRRRMELLASDMITRALVLVSRKNYPQAQKILGETKRILHTVLQTVSKSLPPPNPHSQNGGTIRNRREILILATVRALQAILQDLQVLMDALEDNVELFAHDQRNLGAQQAMILRDQKSWSGRSATERLFWTTDNSIELVSRSNDWVSRD